MGASTLVPTIVPANGGSVTITQVSHDTGPDYDMTTWRIVATPAAGYKFTRFDYTYTWADSYGATQSGSGTTTQSSFDFLEFVQLGALTNQSLTSLTAYFDVDPSAYYTISTSVTPANSGTTTGAGTYAQGASCTVTATPANGFVFAGWYESGVNVSNAASYTFTVSASRSLVAQFVANPSPTEHSTIAVQSKSYGIDPITQQPIYHGDVQLNSRARAKSDSASLQCQTTYTLTAYPDNGWRFKRWVRLSPSSPAKEDANNPYSAMVTLIDETWEAEFEQIPTPTYCTVTAETWVAAQGDVQINSGNISDRESASVQVGATAIVRAIPAAGYSFDHWEIDHNGTTTTSTDREYRLTPTSTSSYWCTAYFKGRTHLLVNSSDRLVPAMLVYDPATNLLVADY